MSMPAQNSLLIPQEATVEQQNKVFVYKVDKSGKVAKTPISIAGKTETGYLVGNGLKAGDIIVYRGIDNLQDGAVISPKNN